MVKLRAPPARGYRSSRQFRALQLKHSLITGEQTRQSVKRQHMRPDPALGIVVMDQRRWSLTAVHLKRNIDRSRTAILLLMIAGAAFEVLGAQIHQWIPSQGAIVGYCGAVALAIVAVVRQWKLGKDHVQAWILARSASESFKREMYLYRTSTGDYSGDDSSSVLLDRRDQILGKVKSIQRYVVGHNLSKIDIPASLDAEGYIAERVKTQIEWFQERADRAENLQNILEDAQFIVAIGGALLGTALTITGSQAYGSWVAVITTIIAAAGTYLATQRFVQQMISYRSAADRLESITARFQLSNSDYHRMIERCEAVLGEENESWIAGADEIIKTFEVPDQRIVGNN